MTKRRDKLSELVKALQKNPQALNRARAVYAWLNEDLDDKDGILTESQTSQKEKEMSEYSLSLKGEEWADNERLVDWHCRQCGALFARRDEARAHVGKEHSNGTIDPHLNQIGFRLMTETLDRAAFADVPSPRNQSGHRLLLTEHSQRQSEQSKKADLINQNEPAILSAMGFTSEFVEETETDRAVTGDMVTEGSAVAPPTKRVKAYPGTVQEFWAQMESFRLEHNGVWESPGGERLRFWSREVTEPKSRSVWILCVPSPYLKSEDRREVARQWAIVEATKRPDGTLVKVLDGRHPDGKGQPADPVVPVSVEPIRPVLLRQFVDKALGLIAQYLTGKEVDTIVHEILLDVCRDDDLTFTREPVNDNTLYIIFYKGQELGRLRTGPDRRVFPGWDRWAILNRGFELYGKNPEEWPTEQQQLIRMFGDIGLKIRSKIEMQRGILLDVGEWSEQHRTATGYDTIPAQSLTQFNIIGELEQAIFAQLEEITHWTTQNADLAEREAGAMSRILLVRLANRRDVYRHLKALCDRDKLFCILAAKEDDDLEALTIADNRIVHRTGKARGHVIGTVRLLPAGANVAILFEDKDAAFHLPISDEGKAHFLKYYQRAFDHFDRLGLIAQQLDPTSTDDDDSERESMPAEREAGPTLRTKLRGEVFKKLKDAHPEWTQERVAMEAREELGEHVNADHVRNTYRALGWKWERADRIR